MRKILSGAALLEVCWSSIGSYMDPSSSANARQELADRIGGFHMQTPGARVVLTSGASLHNDRIYFIWRLIAQEGQVAMDAVDFGKPSEDGRIQEIVGFFDPPLSL